MSKTLFVTGKLACEALNNILRRINPPFEYEVVVLPISVAALMNVSWVRSQLCDARGADLVLLPGLCQGDVNTLAESLGVQVMKGPKDLRDLPNYFGFFTHQKTIESPVQIVAEIVDVHKLSLDEVLLKAYEYSDQGASIIDLGGPVKGPIPNIKEIVSTLKKRGFRVSLDSFDVQTALEADEVGLDLYLSVNDANIEVASQLSCPVVVIPDFEDKSINSLIKNVKKLKEINKKYIVDPVMDPLPFGFSQSVHRFVEYRNLFPNDDMFMGIGNLTELTEADSTGINALLLGICVELKVRYVLTTEVIGWAKGAVKESMLAGRLMGSAKELGVLPKGFNAGLVTAKDMPFEPYHEDEIVHMYSQVQDKNFRIFVIGDTVYLFNNSVFLKSSDMETLYQSLNVDDPSHAFYLGRELERAFLAAKLGKKYVQERPLSWGYMSEDDL